LKNKSEVSTSDTIDLNILFNLSENIQCVIDTGGNFKKVNHQLIRESGLSESQLLRVDFLSILHPEDQESVRRTLLTLVPNSAFEFEARCNHITHSKKIHSWKATLSNGNIYISAKNLNQQIPIAKDLHERLAKPVVIDSSVPQPLSINSGELTGHNEHRFQALVQNSTDIVAILSVEGNFQYVSPSVKRILGFDPEYYINKSAFSSVHPDDVRAVMSSFDSCLTKYKVDVPAYRYLSSDGKWHWLETVATNLLHDPSINGIVINSRDVTLNREMEDDILRNSRRFNNLIEYNNEGSFTLSRDWRFTSFNSAIRNTRGLPPGIGIGANIWKVIPNGINTLFYSEFTRAFQQNTAVHFREFSPLFNRWFEINAYPFEDSLTVMIRDISKLKVHQLTLALERRILEMNATSIYSLKEIIDNLLSGFEKIHYGFKTSLSIVDNSKNKIYRVSAPAMSELYGISCGNEIQHGNSPCSNAVRNSSEVYIQDILNENITADFKKILNQYNIRSSRSIPVIDKNKDVLAVITIFNSGHKNALTEETSLIKRLGTILQLLIENNDAKKAAELNNERFHLIMQATSDCIWDYNLTSKQVYRGNGFDKYFNQEAGLEFVNAKKWEHNVHPEDLDRVEKSLEAGLKDQSVKKWIEDYRYLKKDGTYAWVIDKGLIIRDGNNQAIRIVGALQDITELKKNQESLMQSQENYKNMFSNNPTPLWTYDMESKHFSMVNDAALTLYGYTREEFMMLDLFSIRIEADHEKLKMHLESKAFLEDLNVEHEWTHVKKDGTAMIVDVVSHPILINGRRSRLVAIKDITDRKKDRQEILAQNERLREIAHISSHETRKPLASILGLVTLFDKENLSNPLNKEIVQYLEITAHDLDTVIHNIVKKTWLESEASSAYRPDDFN